MSETEAEYYDGFLVNKKPDNVYEGYMKTERELRRINQCHVRKIDELRAEIRGINGAYELLERQVSMFKNCNGSLNSMLKELNAKIDQVQAENESLKQQVSKQNKSLPDTELINYLLGRVATSVKDLDKLHAENEDLKQKNAKLSQLYYGTGRKNSDDRSI